MQHKLKHLYFATIQSERSKTNRESYFETNKKGLENIDLRYHKDRHDTKNTLRRLTPQNMFQGQTKSITDVKQTAIKLDKTTLDAIQHQIQVAVCVFFSNLTVFSDRR